MARPGQWFLPGCRPASSVAESVGAQKNDGHFHCDGVDRWTAPHFMHERGNFGKIGTRPDNIQYFRALAHRSEEHTSELQSLAYLVCRLLLEKKKAAHVVAIL